MIVEIDQDSGFCFGVVNAIQKAEEELYKNEVLYCLGDIVHNSHEVERLNKEGLVVINHKEFAELKGAKVLLRAHGEPPATYKLARKNNITIVDATCPVVLQLQRKIKRVYQAQHKNGVQILIFGKNGHAEVNGLVGQTDSTAIVVEDISDLKRVDFEKDIMLFSQTTKSIDHFMDIVSEINSRISDSADFKFFDTICRQVANRMPSLRTFASTHDVILFVSGKKSSNGRALFEECLKVNRNCYLVSDETEIKKKYLENAAKVGICGATSTPKWLMEKVADRIKQEFI